MNRRKIFFLSIPNWLIYPSANMSYLLDKEGTCKWIKSSLCQRKGSILFRIKFFSKFYFTSGNPRKEIIIGHYYTCKSQPFLFHTEMQVTLLLLYIIVFSMKYCVYVKTRIELQTCTPWSSSQPRQGNKLFPSSLFFDGTV